MTELQQLVLSYSYEKAERTADSVSLQTRETNPAPHF